MAYADFVTAMMAFFLVMWIVGRARRSRPPWRLLPRSRRVRDDVGRRRAARRVQGAPAGRHAATDIRRRPARRWRTRPRTSARSSTRIPALEKIKDQVDIQVTAEGLRIELARHRREELLRRRQRRDVQPGHDPRILRRDHRQGSRSMPEHGRHRRPHRQPAVRPALELQQLGSSRADRANAARRVMEESGFDSASSRSAARIRRRAAAASRQSARSAESPRGADRSLHHAGVALMNVTSGPHQTDALIAVSWRRRSGNLCRPMRQVEHACDADRLDTRCVANRHDACDPTGPA